MSLPPNDAPASLSASGYQDGLGTRTLVFDREYGVMLERLVLRPEFSAFEQALRPRLARLTAIEDERFARVRSIERDPQTGGLIVLSEFIAGHRLADLLDAIANQPRDEAAAPGLDVALGFLLEALPALASLHATAGLTHGAVGPGRIVLTPASQVVLLDTLFGKALERLRFTPHRLWKDFRLAVPAREQPAKFDVAADIAQTALSAVAIAVGRPLSDTDHPEGLPSLVTEVVEIAQLLRTSAFATSLERFLQRTLPLPDRQAYSTVDQALIDLQRLLQVEIGAEQVRKALTDFVAEMSRASAPVATPAGATRRPHVTVTKPAPAVSAPAPAPRPTAVAAPPPRTETPTPAPPRQTVVVTPAAARPAPPTDVVTPPAPAASAPPPPAVTITPPARATPIAPVVSVAPPTPVVVEPPAPAAAVAPPAPVVVVERPAPIVAVEPPAPVVVVTPPAPVAVAPPAPVAPTPAPAPDVPAPIEARTPAPIEPAAPIKTIDTPVLPVVAVEAPKPAPVEVAPAPVPTPPPAPAMEANEPEETAEASDEESADAPMPLVSRLNVFSRRKKQQRGPRAKRDKLRSIASPPAPLAAKPEPPAPPPPPPRPAPAPPPPPPPEPPPLVKPRTVETVWEAPPIRPAERPMPAPSMPQPPVMRPAPPPQPQVQARPLPPPVSPFQPASFQPAPSQTTVPLTPASPTTVPLAPASNAPAPVPLRLKTEAPSTGHVATRRIESPSPNPYDTVADRRPFPRVGEVESAPPAFPWKLAAAAILVMAVGVGALRAYLPTRNAPPETTETPETTPTTLPAPTGAALTGPAGAILIESQPSGAKVLLDGRPAGETPVTLDGVSVGKHVVTLTTASGSVKRVVRVEQGKTASIDVGVFSGWVVVSAPIVLDISENGQALGSSESKVMLSPGHHTLTLSNRSMGYTTEQSVEIEAGEEHGITVDAKGMLSLNASPWAEVWIDGQKAGDTPIANLKVPLGMREVVFKHPEFGERRMTATVTAKAPTALSVDFTKPSTP